ncbi:hypothetical protein [Pseudomonas syringae]|uniref:Uncharacterized protein n=1 Tax=Pseudomonas syringae UB303 TaxID=1357287 RepID=A0AAJ4B1N8_PSESX|nr:hypothetical protein [Pseudomonas syringae]QHF08637.1 hypothetical protein N026_14640 [Pseudomonas syringae UB303]
MDSNTESQLLQDVTKLRVMVSRLTALTVGNTDAILNLSLALAEDTDLPLHAREKAIDVFKSMDVQMELLQEISVIMETNGGR